MQGLSRRSERGATLLEGVRAVMMTRDPLGGRRSQCHATRSDVVADEAVQKIYTAIQALGASSVCASHQPGTELLVVSASQWLQSASRKEGVLAARAVSDAEAGSDQRPALCPDMAGARGGTGPAGRPTTAARHWAGLRGQRQALHTQG